MKHPIHFAESFEQLGPWTLLVRFEDGTARQIDFRPVLHGPLFGPLRDAAVFRPVRLDPEVRTLAWPIGADFDPATLYNWPEQGPLLAAKVREWEAVIRPRSSETVKCGHRIGWTSARSTARRPLGAQSCSRDSSAGIPG